MTDEDKKKLAEAKKALLAAERQEAPKATEEVAEEVTETKVKAKAGKRSAKSVREAEEAEEKEDRKQKVADGELDPSTNADGEVVAKRGPVPVTRTRLARRGKAYRKATELIKADTKYSIKDAVEIVKKNATAKFDESIEVHMRLGVDPKYADQNVRSSLVLPNGTGSTQRVAVFASAEHHEAAKKAGADIIGEEAVIALLKKEEINFDVLIATPDVMAKLGRYARLLGPRGLMPNPKSGTVTKDVTKAVKEAKAGRIEFRVDKQGNIHQLVGKASFKQEALVENITALAGSIQQVRPSSLKGDYILSAYVTSTMGPSVKVTV